MKLRKHKRSHRLRMHPKHFAELQNAKQWHLIRELVTSGEAKKVGMGVSLLMRMVPDSAKDAIAVWANHKPAMFEYFFR